MLAALYVPMSYQCGSCGHLFTEREALCEDWRKKERCFICPNCNLYLEQPNAGNSWKSLLLLLGIMVVATFVIQAVLDVMPAETRLYVAAVIFLASVIAGVWAFVRAKPILVEPHESQNV